MISTYSLAFQFMETLGKKWILPVLIFLFVYETCTFSGIKKELKVTSRVLSRKLRLLESLGLVERSSRSNRASYKISDKGKRVSKSVLKLISQEIQPS